MVKALARAFRWRKLIERDVTATVAETATAETINTSYVSRIIRLTLLGSDVVEMNLDGRQPADLTLEKLMEPFPEMWAAVWGWGAFPSVCRGVMEPGACRRHGGPSKNRSKDMGSEVMVWSRVVMSSYDAIYNHSKNYAGHKSRAVQGNATILDLTPSPNLRARTKR